MVGGIIIERGYATPSGGGVGFGGVGGVVETEEFGCVTIKFTGSLQLVLLCNILKIHPYWQSIFYSFPPYTM